MKDKYIGYLEKIKDNFIVYDKNEQISKKIKYTFLMISFYLFIFQYLLQEHVGIFKYWDEFYSMLFFPIISIKIFKLAKEKQKVNIKRDDKIILFSSIIIIIMGVIGNIAYGYQELSMIPQEILLVFKFLLSFYTTKMIFKDLKIYHNEKIANHTKLITVFLFILIILDYIFGFFPYTIRYGIKSEQLFFGHQTILAAVMIVNLSLLLLCSNSKNKKYYIFINLLIIAMTLRAKALAIVVIFGILYYWIITKGKNINLKLIIVIIIVAVVVASQQIYFYFIDISDSARSVLLKTSFVVANDHFPIGSGFATFATYLSGENYSKIYEKYGIENTYGIRKGNAQFISDNFWPAIIGEFGYLGLILYSMILILMYKKIHKKYRENRTVYLAALVPFLYLLVASTAESAFLHTVAVSMFFIIGLTIDEECTEK